MFKDFPSLHPFAVHFTIVLILLAVAFQAIVVWKPSWQQVRWVSLSIMAVAFLSAWATSTIFHAEPSPDMNMSGGGMNMGNMKGMKMGGNDMKGMNMNVKKDTAQRMGDMNMDMKNMKMNSETNMQGMAMPRIFLSAPITIMIINGGQG